MVRRYLTAFCDCLVPYQHFRSKRTACEVVSFSKVCRMEASSRGVCAELCGLHRSCLLGKVQLASPHHISSAPTVWLFLPRDGTGVMSAQVGLGFWCGYE